MKKFAAALKRGTSRAFTKSLDIIETVGNKLPHPATLFALLAITVMIVSWVATQLSYQAIHPVSGDPITVKSLISAEGIRWIYTSVIRNFVNFPPLGYVLVVMVGIGVAEGSGLFTVMIRALVLGAPKKAITGAIVAAGLLSHLASEAGYVILIPARGHDLSCPGPPPHGRVGGRVLRGERRVRRQLPGRLRRSHPGRVVHVGGPDHRSRHDRQSRRQFLFHVRLGLSHRRSGNLGDREDRRAPAGALRRSRRKGSRRATDAHRKEGPERSRLGLFWRPSSFWP
jgi:hypothetical protein